jgi:hypothetical protein
MNSPSRPGMMDQDRYSHSMPHTPLSQLDHNPPGPPLGNLESAFNHMRNSIPGGYFDMGRPGPYPASLRPGSPLPRPPYGPDFGPPNFGAVSYGPSLSHGPELYMGPDSSYGTQYGLEELIRKLIFPKPSIRHWLTEPSLRTNLAVQLVNGQISHTAKYAQLQPKMCRDGRFPDAFHISRTVEEIKAMDCTAHHSIHPTINPLTLLSIYH